MKKYFTLPLLLMLLTSPLAWSHGDGHGPVSEEKAITLAINVTTRFTEEDIGQSFGKLPSSWAGLEKGQAGIHEKGEGYYIVALENPGKDKTLYILVSLNGEVYDANFTGTFEGVNDQ